MKKSFIMALALVLVLGIAIGGTVAWLTDKTDTVENTFTAGDVDISLTETKQSNGDTLKANEKWNALLVPGASYTKDPTVSVNRDNTNVDIYLFVKFEEKNNPSTYLDYNSTLNSDNGWTKLNGVDGVWYREVKTTDTTLSWKLLADLTDAEGQSTGKQVAVKTTLVKETMEAENFEAPELKYTAYAIQTEGFATAALAWAEVSK